MKLFAFFLVFTIQTAQAQFFDKQGVFLEDVSSPPSELIGWTKTEITKQSNLKSNIVIGFSVVPYEFICSGTIFRPRQVPLSHKALVLTNGHCTPFLNSFIENPKLQIVDHKFSGIDSNYGVVVNNFIDSPEKRLYIKANRIVYSSMYKRDLGIIEISLTYLALRDYHGIEPSLIATDLPQVGDSIFSVGTPMASMGFEDFYHHTSVCRHLGEVSLVEGPISTTTAIQNNCSLNSGQSGSGLFTENGMIYGLQITGYDRTQKEVDDCGIGKPCELSGGEKKANFRVSYGIYVADLEACFKSNGDFNLDLEHCPLR